MTRFLIGWKLSFTWWAMLLAVGAVWQFAWPVILFCVGVF